MDSDMMRHWGHRRDIYRPYGDDELVQEEPEEPKRETLVGLKLMAIHEEECSQDTQSVQASQDGSMRLVPKEEEEEVGNDVEEPKPSNNKKSPVKDDKEDDDQVSDHDEVEGPHNDFHSSPLHSAFGLQAEDLMLNNSMAADTSAKYRTVSVFGGVFGLPEDEPVDSDNCSLSSASDGFSSDEDYGSPPKRRSPKRKAPQKRNLARAAATPQTTTTTPPSKAEAAAPRVVSPPITASSPPTTNEPETNDTTSPKLIRDPPALVSRSISIAASPTDDAEKNTVVAAAAAAALSPPLEERAEEATIETPAHPVPKSPLGDSSSVTRALQAFDETENLLSKVLGELDAASAAPFFAPQVMEDAMTSLQLSKQTLESALCLEDSVLSC